MFTNRFDGQAAVAQVLPGFFGAFNLQRQRHTRTPATLNRRLAFIRNTDVGRFRQLKFYKPSGVMGDWQPQTIFVEIDCFLPFPAIEDSICVLWRESIEMTMRYAHPTTEGKMNAVNALERQMATLDKLNIGSSAKLTSVTSAVSCTSQKA